MWKKKVSGARESLICMTSVGSLWTRHVDSLSWPTLADVLQRRMKLKERAGVTQRTHNVRTCFAAFLFIYLLIYLLSFSKSWLIFVVDLFVGSCWGKEWGQIWIIFPRGGMKYKTHTRQHFISVYVTLILQPLGRRFLCESWPTSTHLPALRWSVTSFLLEVFFFFRLALKHWMLS